MMPPRKPSDARKAGGVVQLIPLKPRPRSRKALDEAIRSCLYGSSCGCATRKCHAVPPGQAHRTVRMAAECRECMLKTWGLQSASGPPLRQGDQFRAGVNEPSA